MSGAGAYRCAGASAALSEPLSLSWPLSVSPLRTLNALSSATSFSTALTVAHVAVSRAYLLRDGRTEQLTTDHSLVATLVADGTVDAATARTHPMRAVILRAVGLDDAVAPDVTTVQTQCDDITVVAARLG